MAFADPQSVTINAVANSLPRTGLGETSGTFSKDDQTVQLTISHQKARAGRSRHMIRLDHSKITPDVLVSGTNVRANVATYLVVDAPAQGYTLAEIKQVVDGLTAYLTATSGARVTQLLGGES